MASDSDTDAHISHDEESFDQASQQSDFSYDSDFSWDSHDQKHSSRRFCGPCFTAKRCCHAFYILQLCLYVIVFPLWCKYLVTAPKPAQFWNEEWPLFPLIHPVKDMGLAVGSAAKPQIDISPMPTTGDKCNYTCSKALHDGQQTDEMNFPLSLTMNLSWVVSERAETLFPVLLTSSDFEHWQVAADRRDAEPQGFWEFRKSGLQRAQTFLTPPCTKHPEASFGIQNAYVLACVSWSRERVDRLLKSDNIDPSEFQEVCDAMGGVCGWPCESDLPSDRLPMCSADGIVDMKSYLAQIAPGDNISRDVTIRACLDDKPFTACEESLEPFGRWRCHQCVGPGPPKEEEDEEGKDGEGDDKEDEGDEFKMPTGGMAGPPPPLHRRLKDRRLFPLLDDEDQREIYRSLPRMKVTLGREDVPKPHIYMFTAASLRGPFKALYQAPGDPTDEDRQDPPRLFKPNSKGNEDDDSMDEYEDAVQEPSLVHSMSGVDFAELKIKPKSCYGRRGPLYIVACAVNASAYREIVHGQAFEEFKRGQAAAPPPFNDRCLAVSGRCGTACTDPTGAPPMLHCDANGYIKQSALVGDVAAPTNREPYMWLLVYILVIGFCCKVGTLIPGILRPYKHCQHYYPALTEQLGHIVVCTPSASSDENKRTTIRSLVGSIAAMPSDIRCRYHVVLLDEMHRAEMKICWQRFIKVVDAIPGSVNGIDAYQENLAEFFGAWCEETRKLNLQQIGNKVAVPEQGILDKISGLSALRIVRQELGWSKRGPLDDLERALLEFAKDLETDNSFTQGNINRDDVTDWAPRQGRCFLRVHYIARARPREDERTNRVQHVAPGTWYYTIPGDVDKTPAEDWLTLRRSSVEMVYGIDRDQAGTKVPLRTSRGKSGGLNFVNNYMHVIARREDNVYGDDQDFCPSLFSVAHARHQYQPDFMTSTVPHFFDKAHVLNERVAYTQCPLHYHTTPDKTDYLDSNHASWFRLTCMIRQCCGGVFSCGSNCTWLVQPEADDSVWMKRKARVRSKKRMRMQEVFEKQFFSEDTKVEDTAGSLQAMLSGKHAQFVNRKLSYGMAKPDLGAIASRQRWSEGGVVLLLQQLHRCGADLWILLVAALAALGFMISVFRLVTWDVELFLVVRLRILSQKNVESFLEPIDRWINEILSKFWTWHLLGTGVENSQIYATMLRQVVMWLITLVVVVLTLWGLSTFFKMCTKNARLFPNSLRHWGRLAVSLQSLTDFMWYWTAFVWLGFNVFAALGNARSHFEYGGVIMFTVAINLLSWGMAIANSCRYSLGQSMDANEIASMSIDSIWRSNQQFYMMAPVHLYSIVRGIGQFLKWRFYGVDISYWEEAGEGDDQGKRTVSIVKWWTLLLVLLPVGLWIQALVAHLGRETSNELEEATMTTSQIEAAWAARIVLTIVALDLLHPCAFLFLREQGSDKELGDEQAKKIRWSQAVCNSRWWRRILRKVVLNPFLASVLKYVGPAYFLLLPLLCLWTTWFGVTASFMLVTPA